MIKLDRNIIMNSDHVVNFLKNGGKIKKCKTKNAYNLSSIKRYGLFGGVRSYIANIHQRNEQRIISEDGISLSPQKFKRTK